MPSSTSPNKNLELQATGENDGTWGTLLNAVLSTLDLNLGGRLNLSVAGAADVTLNTTQAKNIYHNYSGTLTGSISVIFPATNGGLFLIKNATSGAYTLTVKPSGGTGISVPQGTSVIIFIDPDQTSAVTVQPLLVSGGGLESFSGALQRSALTGHVTASAGSNTTAIAILTTRGDVLIHDGAVKRLALGATNTIFGSDGTDSVWRTLSVILDAVIGSTRGMLAVRGASTWGSLATGAAGTVLGSDGTDPAWVSGPTESLIIAASDETTALTAGATKVTFRMPYAFTLTGIRASLTTAQTSGNIFTVDVNEAGTTVISTKITIDNGEKTSTTAVAAPVISDASLADDALMTVDIDQIGDGTAKGLKVTLIGKRT